MKNQKKESPRCAWCSRGRASADGTRIFCAKYGVMDAMEHCPSFDYDPLRRQPDPQPSLPNIDEDAFRL